MGEEEGWCHYHVIIIIECRNFTIRKHGWLCDLWCVLRIGARLRVVLAIHESLLMVPSDQRLEMISHLVGVHVAFVELAENLAVDLEHLGVLHYILLLYQAQATSSPDVHFFFVHVVASIDESSSSFVE